MKTRQMLAIILLSLGLGGYGWWRVSGAALETSGDLNGDNISDLVIGAPGETIPDSPPGTSQAGAINLIYGKQSEGLTTNLDQYLHRGVSDVVYDPGEYDRFGSALATGDFNCDGFADLAVGVPGQDVSGYNEAGAVHIFYGYYFGLLYLPPPNNFVLTQNTGCLGNLPEENDFFGQTLASGDFNGDGCSDLAIGVPGENWTSIVDVGMVHVIYGANGGFAATGCQYITQGDGLSDSREASDRFGAALATGNFGSDAYDDLAIGAPGETFDSPYRKDAGAVHIVYGANSGLNISSDQYWHQDKVELDGMAESNDQFGAALASGNFDGYGGDDLAIGVPGQDVGLGTKAGAVHVLFSNMSNLLSTGNQVLNQDSIWDPYYDPQPGNDEEFGAALAAGDFNGDGFLDLAIGVPGDHYGIMVAKTCGAVNLFYGALGALATANAQEWSHFDSGLLGVCDDGDEFGRALAAGNFNHDGYDDLAVGVPGDNLNKGTVHILVGRKGSLSAEGNQLWSQDSHLIDGTAEFGDRFGGALAAVPGLNARVFLPVMVR